MKDLDAALFFNEHPEAFPLYKELEDRILADIRDVNIKVQKSQITFSNKHNFAFVSFLPPRLEILGSVHISCYDHLS